MENLNWISGQLFQYLILATGLISLTGLWLAAKAEVHSCRKELDGLSWMLTELAEKVDASAATAAAVPEVVAPAPARSASRSINLTKRTKVLKMARRGEAIPTIAAALEIPRGEVDLLLKLDQLLERRTA